MLMPLLATSARAQTWTADNGNGTFTNPLFYDEFSDPDLICVGDDFYLTGTTMHAMPGLPILHSKDLVNWNFVGYVFDRLDLGPGFRLQDGKGIYGQGIWAPSFRCHNGTFYIFSNINGRKTQLFTATDPAGPWTRREMKKSLHDLSVLFDDDGKAYAVWGYRDIHLAQLTDDLTDFVPGTERVIIKSKKDNARDMGEGLKIHKFDGTYYILSAWWSGRMRMPCARAKNINGPYEVNPEISADEDFGLAEGNRLVKPPPPKDDPFALMSPDPQRVGRMSMHQGSIIQTPAGEWWGYSMMDYNSVGRLLCLSPITWKDGWPYFGLPGNLGRTPRTWTKPNVGGQPTTQPLAPYERSDDFANKLKPVWQWNHLPDDGKWSLIERPGFLRLHSLPAADFWHARNTLTQRSIGPMSTATAELDASGLKDGDVAGLALLNYPYTWIGVKRDSGKLTLARYDQTTDKTHTADFTGTRGWLRADCDFLTEKATLSYSLDGHSFQPLGEPFTMIFQGRTFQGVRYSLFNFNTANTEGGHADFDSITVEELHPRGLMRPIPYGEKITVAGIEGELRLVAKEGTLTAVANAPDSDAAYFTVVDRSLGRVALKAGDAFVSVDAQSKVGLQVGEPGNAETFQWTETVYGDLVLLSLRSQRLLNIDPKSHSITANGPGPRPDRKDGTWLRFAVTPTPK